MPAGSRLDACLPLRRHPAFWAILAVKVVLSFLLGSHYLRDLFLPFVSAFVDSGFANPWDAAAAGAHPNAFPYSGAMLVLLSAPQALASAVLPAGIAAWEPLRMFLFRLPLLAADLAILAVLVRWFDRRRDAVLWLYWASPILAYITYVHGQVDALPSAFLFLSLNALFGGATVVAGLLLGVGIGAKMHLLVALPFLLVWLWRNTGDGRRARALGAFAGSLLLALGAVIGPTLSSPGYRRMVLGTPEVARLFELAIPVSSHLVVYAGPAALLVIFLRFVHAAKVGRDLVILFLALAFGVLVLLLPPMPGWYYWSLPLAACFFLRQETISTFSYWLVNGLYVVYYGLFWTDPATGAAPLIQRLPGPLGAAVDAESAVFTALQMSLAMTIYWTYRVGIRSSPDFSLRQQPFLVGVGGDSGAGKHTLVRAFRDVVGTANSIQDEGDHYHRFDRVETARRDLTPLDPRANRMFLPAENLQALKRGRTVLAPVYDHATGTFQAPGTLSPAAVVFFVGLHPFYLRGMRRLLDLKIFVEPDEGLRRFWKVRRDQRERGYDEGAVRAQLQQRGPDSLQHVQPQRRFADWVIGLHPESPVDESTDPAVEPVLRARHVLPNELPLEDLVRRLEALPGLAVTWTLGSDMERQVLEIRGSPTALQVEAVARELFPDLAERLGPGVPRWQAGPLGPCQLLFLMLMRDGMAGDPR